jgi:hypothetical protein
MFFALLLAAQPAPMPGTPAPEVINDLADAPPAWERFRFPPSAVAESALHLNAAFRQHLERERPVWP